MAGDSLRALGALPTWLLARLLAPALSPSHPWHGRRFSLADWHACQTPFCRVFDVLMTGSFVCLIITLLLIFAH